MDQQFTDHYKLAEQITWEMFDDVDDEQRRIWESRHDIVWEPYNFRLPSRVPPIALEQWATIAGV
jgi:hypothetical protein